MIVSETVVELVERYRLNEESYRSAKYNEAQVRHEFIDPFFMALGWDVNNTQGYTETYKDVIHEDSLRIGDAVKAPDYSFRIGGARVFFVEAKKPSLHLKEDAAAAFQLRRYAWSANLTLSILTNFREFAIYDCRVRPQATDKASVARTMYFTFNEIEERWPELNALFSRNAVLTGRFEGYARSAKAKRGTAEVDEAFLSEIEAWRSSLASEIALRNPTIDRRSLNSAVTRTIDRIVFLRIGEDRAIEPYGQLREIASGKDIYSRLFDLFHRSDDKYNSGLFHFRKETKRPEAPDILTPNLSISDKPLRIILGALYYPQSPYEFSVIPSHILGQVYEQFLGKIIRLTPAHRAVVEFKPEVKKAGGVYYTPAYIVKYIVETALTPLLNGKSPKEVASIRIVDPACGSGSFLLGAYQMLLDWHLDFYLTSGTNVKRRKEIYQTTKSAYRLTTAERKRILLNNIYGVDIDSEAVETTKLSLLLKVLEGESVETLSSQLKLFQERALPDLSNNVRCGNSLVAPDLYKHTQMSLLSEDQRFAINVFDWRAEFPAIFAAGGFDAVTGNPPYAYRNATQDILRDYL